jgi:hypothetical protein
MNIGLALLLLGAPRAAADVYPIAPVDAALRVEPDRTVADVDSDAVYWIEEALNQHPLPPRDWPASALASAEAYVNAHLRLTVDGKPLTGRLVSATYRQSLGDVNEQGRVRLRLVYPALAGGATLAGEADFFEEYRREELSSNPGFKDLHGEPQVFETRLRIPGRVPRSFTLTPGADSFRIAVSDARRTAAALAGQSVLAGAAQVASSWTAWPALLALALSLGPAGPARPRAAALVAAAAAGARLPLPAPAGVLWAGGAAAAVGAGRWLGAGAAPWLEAAALAALGRGWAAAALAELPGAVPGPAERGLAALGALAGAAAALAVGVLLVGAERRRLAGVSESRAAELFERRRKLCATVLGLVCAVGLCAGRNW